MSPSNSQKRASSKPFPTSLNHQLDHKLLAYATAASAAGVSILALAPPSQAEIVYTPTHQVISTRGTISLDLNNDGVTDFTIAEDFSVCGEPASPPECSGYTRQRVFAIPSARNAVVVGARWAPALPSNVNIGPAKKFGNFGSMEVCSTSIGRGPYSSGPWINARSRYLGLSITVDGQVYYGWARLTVSLGTPVCHGGVILTGYAYETDAGKPIATGQTSETDKISETERPKATLGALALGSAGLVAWGRDEEADESKN